jgi:hypothetical protein
MDCPPLDVVQHLDNPGQQPRPKRVKWGRYPGSKVCHAEDLRIYGGKRNRYHPQQLVPSSSNHPHQKGVDSEWNLEHGDSIPPIMFRMARLSQEYSLEDELKRFHNEPWAAFAKSLTSTDVTIDQRDVPRALIEKCWERAVHIASNTMVVPITATTSAATATKPSAQETADSKRTYSSPRSTGKSPRLDREARRKQCESLGIDIESLRTKMRAKQGGAWAKEDNSGDEETTCPRCTRAFPTTEALLDHYYGSCCQDMIRPRHLDLIRSLLQTHAESQLDQIGNLFLSQAVAVNSRAKLDWRDVRRCLQTAVETSTPIPTNGAAHRQRSEPRHPVQESIHVASAGGNGAADADSSRHDHQQPPLMLNRMILEAVNRRLIDRYADLPP